MTEQQPIAEKDAGLVPATGHVRYYRFFRVLVGLHVPEPVYYWFLDRLTDNNGWRPLFYRERRNG